MTKEGEVRSATAEPEKAEQRVAPQNTKGVTKAKKQRAANPYGAWEKIKQEEDP